MLRGFWRAVVVLAALILAIVLVPTSTEVEAQPVPLELNALCVNSYTHVVSAPATITGTACPTGSYALLIPDSFPFTLSVSPFTGMLLHTIPPLPGYPTISLPEAGNVQLCLNFYTRRLTFVPGGNCPSGTFNVVIVGQIAPDAVDDGPYTVQVANNLNEGAPGLLANDDLGLPAATIVSFGGGDLAGDATTNAAGTTLVAGLAGGDLTVNADGSFSLVNPTTPGDYSFDYRLENPAGFDDATVTIEVQGPPTAVDDGPASNSAPGDLFHTALDTTLDSTATAGDDNLLSNDDRGFPLGDVTFFGDGDLGGSVTDHAAGNTVTPLPGETTGSLTVNTDGSFSFTPPTGFTGQYSFDYRLANTAGSSDATVTIAVGTRPSATDDSYGDTVLGNVSIDTTVSSSFSVLTNDTGDGLTVTGFDGTSVNGGDVAVNTTTGTFTYDPPVGYEGNDSFTYTIDNGFSDPQMGTVSLTVSGMLWFIDVNAASGGDGRLSGPFDCLVSATCFSTLASDDPGDNIFLASGAYTGGVTLLDNQRFIGEGATDTLATITGLTPPADSATLPATNGTAPQITTSNADAIMLGSGNTVRGLNVGDTGTGTGISGTNFGTLTLSEVAVSGTGRAVNLDNGTAAVTFDSLASAGSSSQGVNLNAVSGSFTVSGTTDIDSPGDDGVAINASPASFSFQGATSVDGATVNGIDLSGGNGTVTFSSIDLDTIASVGLRVQNNTNAVNINGGSIGATDDPGGNAVDIDAGSANISVAASVTKTTAGEVVEVTGRSGGTVTLSNTLTCNSGCTGINVSSNTSGTTSFSGAATVNSGSSTAVNLTNNGGHTVSFSGGLDVDTSSGTGFNATGGGMVNVTGATNTVDTTAGTAVNVNATTIGGSGMTFLRVSAAGASHGIRLNTTGGGAFTVTGSGTTDGSGGTVQNIAQRGAEFISASNISLSNMTFTNANQNDGAVSDGTSGGNENTDENGAIYLDMVTNVSLTNVDINGAVQHGINGNMVTNLDITNSEIQNTGDEVWESGVYIFQLRGTQGASQDNVFDNTSIHDTGQFNVFVRNNGATNAAPGAMDRLVFQNCSFADSGNNFDGDHVTISNRDTANFQTVVSSCSFTATIDQTSDSIQVDAGDTSHSDAQITGSTFLNGNLAINISGSGTSTTTFNVSNNPSISSRGSSGVNIASNSSASMTGTVNSNTISSNIGNSAGIGIDVVVDATGSAIVSADNNTVSNYSLGFRGGARNAGTGTADLTLTNNSFSTGGTFGFEAVYLFSGNGSGGESNEVCVNLSNNTASSAQVDDYFLEQYTGNTFQIQGLTPASGATQAQVESFVASTDTGSPTVDAFGGTIVNYTAATCATP